MKEDKGPLKVLILVSSGYSGKIEALQAGSRRNAPKMRTSGIITDSSGYLKGVTRVQDDAGTPFIKRPW